MIIHDKGYGIILILSKNLKKDRFLILHQTKGHWSFPKGHAEKEEAPKEVAIRELEEETGITDIEFPDLPSVKENYKFEENNQRYNKTVEYFIAFTKNDKVKIQESEIQDYKWATYNEAIKIPTFKSKEVLKEAQEYLKNMVK